MLPVARALWQALLSHPQVGLEAIALAAAAVLLPLARGRGPWAAGAFGAAMLVLTLVPTRGASALPLAAAALLTVGLLVAEPRVRARH